MVTIVKPPKLRLSQFVPLAVALALMKIILITGGMPVIAASSWSEGIAVLSGKPPLERFAKNTNLLNRNQVVTKNTAGDRP